MPILSSASVADNTKEFNYYRSVFNPNYIFIRFEVEQACFAE
jgi:hypothetical protein